MEFPIPENEDERLASLSQLNLIDGPANRELDAIVKLVATSLDCASAVVSLAPDASLAAARAWEAATGKGLHYMVGKDAERAKFMTRWIPGWLRGQVKKSVPERG